jgi:hypothetical protein
MPGVTEASVLVLEYVVEELDQALQLLVDVVGFDVIDRYPHAGFDAEVVTLRAGAVAINLIHPTDVGDRPPFGSPEPRLAQITVGVPGEDGVAALAGRLADAGAAVVAAQGSIYLAPKMIEAVFGTAPTLLFTALP